MKGERCRDCRYYQEQVVADGWGSEARMLTCVAGPDDFCLLEDDLETCPECGTSYAPGEDCPQCLSVSYRVAEFVSEERSTIDGILEASQ